MIANPIDKVLSTLMTHKVRYLLMGGQACILYGGAEFSRDADIVVLADKTNLDLLQAVFDELKAEVIAVPDFSREMLEKGHAVHVRCQHPDVRGLRIDVMSNLRGVDDFDALWKRRTTLEKESGGQYEVLGLGDLVKAKKTQRDKDWPMIRRLLEAHYVANRLAPTKQQVNFWLKELRTPEYLIEVAAAFPESLRDLKEQRSLLRYAESRDIEQLREALRQEEDKERRKDAEYWRPLRKELESLRHKLRE